MTIDTIGTLSSARLDRSAPVEASTTPAGRAPAAATATATAVKAKEAPASMAELKDAVGKLNESPHAQSLEFSIDEDSKRTVVKVIDVATKEVLRQMPSEEALRIAKSLDKASGLLIRQQA
jgi:flagellar protein FlaG